MIRLTSPNLDVELYNSGLCLAHDFRPVGLGSRYEYNKTIPLGLDYLGCGDWPRCPVQESCLGKNVSADAGRFGFEVPGSAGFRGPVLLQPVLSKIHQFGPADQPCLVHVLYVECKETP